MATKCKKNYYDILGVTPDSSDDEVKSSYRKLARKYHPDVNKEAGSEEKFKDVLEAYETLSSEAKRKQYDMLNGFYKRKQQDFSKKKTFREDPCVSKEFAHQNVEEDEFEEFEEFEPATNKSKKNNEEKKQAKSNNDAYDKKKDKNETYSNKFFRDRVNSILDDISKHHKDKTQTRIPKDGEDIYTDIAISFKESISGTERLLNIMHKELCPHCQGRKFINGSKCTKCLGSGVFEERRKITVKIPAGVKNNSKLRLIGEGNPGFFGGKNGNIYIKIIVEPNENMTLEGNNILYNLRVSPFEAVLGEAIDIPTFDGNLKFSLPPMTKSGQKFRIAKKGLKTNGHVGDMIITVEIQLPETLSNDEINLYTKLKKISNNSVRDIE